MRIGVLGAGQLARMLALAGHPLGLEFVFLSPDPDPCAAPLGEHICAGYDDEEGVEELARRADIVTFEFENVPSHTVAMLAQRMPVFPSADALTLAQDRLLEKRLFEKLGIPTPPFAPIDSRADLQAALADLGLPALLKTRREGYDGKGQATLRSSSDVDEVWTHFEGKSPILESFIPFDRELSIIGVRGRSGETLFYPVSENVHGAGVLHLSTCRRDDPMQARAEEYARRLLSELDYVGILALELFQVGDLLIANEFAPRVHNSGHWTIEGAETSQFENHLRAVTGLPLGSVAPRGAVAMVNFIGSIPPAAEVLKHPGVHLHAYGKSFRAGRKVGHATVRRDDSAALEEVVSELLSLAKSSDLR